MKDFTDPPQTDNLEMPFFPDEEEKGTIYQIEKEEGCIVVLHIVKGKCESCIAYVMSNNIKIKNLMEMIITSKIKENAVQIMCNCIYEL